MNLRTASGVVISAVGVTGAMVLCGVRAEVVDTAAKYMVFGMECGTLLSWMVFAGLFKWQVIRISSCLFLSVLGGSMFFAGSACDLPFLTGCGIMFTALARVTRASNETAKTATKAIRRIKHRSY